MKKRIPIGYSEFREVIEGNFYYVDKTKLVEEIIVNSAKVTLFTRPRRFGKTLNMTMLREFFDVMIESKSLFEGLYIGQTEHMQEANTYPTLFFSFRDCKGSKEEILIAVKQILMKEYQNHLYLKEQLSEYEEKRYEKIYRELEETDSPSKYHCAYAISFLSTLLFKYYKKPIILIIDEYDTPIVESFVNDSFEELRSFFATLYASALKDNSAVAKGILTGIQRVAKENIFSGLNNLEVITVIDEAYNDYFGMTTEETDVLLGCYEKELTTEVARMYNGYQFGGEQIREREYGVDLDGKVLYMGVAHSGKACEVLLEER